MQELRWNPVHKWWVMLATNRQHRPLMPQGWCPFCPKSTKVPDNYQVYVYPNDFPILLTKPSTPNPEISLNPENQDLVDRIFQKKLSIGQCEVILYSPDHFGRLYDLSEKHLLRLVQLWQNRVDELSRNPDFNYIYIFENRGEAVGVTMPHPHGQLYAYSFIPRKIQEELDFCSNYNLAHHRNFHDDWLLAEKAVQSRMVFETDSWGVFVPFWAEYPYQLTVIPKKKFLTLSNFTTNDLLAFGKLLQQIVWMYDQIYQSLFPYMMVFHAAPINTGKDYSYYRFHVEFYPPLRTANTQKFNASSETGAWVHGNPTSPEEKALEMRTIIQQYNEQS